jgi:hypothetical protein
MSVSDIIRFSKPESLDFPALSANHAEHVVYLAQKGYTKLAADHLLHREMIGHLEETVGSVIRRFNLIFNRIFLKREDSNATEYGENILLCARIYDTLIQMALNLIGFERDIVGFPNAESNEAYLKIVEALESFEDMERNGTHDVAPIAETVTRAIISDMSKVMSGFYRPPGSMLTHMAREIEKNIEWSRALTSFLNSAKNQIQGNIYYRLSKAGICRFGNDYALGLRWLRHLGFVQVSTNPVLAAASYDDDPSLWDGYKGEDLCPDFKSEIEENLEMLEKPHLFSDELAAKGTEISIWPNLVVFRPIAVASNMRHGMISLQLNPKIADDFEKSFREALKIYFDAEKFLRKYDHYLLWGYSASFEHGRPNIVFKVAGSSPAAIELTRKLESLGIGTNNTVTFTVSQEVELILAKISGRAKAVKKGIRPTTVYETNMGGRLDDHIREVQAEELLREALKRSKNTDEDLRRLFEALGGIWGEIKDKASLEDKIRAICSRRFLSPINKEPFINFLAEYGVPYASRDKVADYLARLEEDISYCGILVTKRVYEIFFSLENRPKWISYIQSKFNLSPEQAEMVLQGIDVLPASKRKPKETLLTLGSMHITHTEFPNHQTNVLLESLKADFNPENYRDSILREVDPEIALRLSLGWSETADNFVKAYELTPEQIKVLEEVGVANPYKYGTRGLRPSEWGSYGATVKTMEEFSRSYEQFKKKCVEFALKLLRAKSIV